MKSIPFFRGFIDKIDAIGKETVAMKEGIVNQSALLNDKLSEIIGNIVNEQKIINDKLNELIDISLSQNKNTDDNLSYIMRDFSDKFAEWVKISVSEQHIINDKLDKLIASSENEQRILNDKLGELIESSVNEQRILNDKLGELIAGSVNEQRIVHDKLSQVIDILVDQSDGRGEGQPRTDRAEPEGHSEGPRAAPVEQVFIGDALSRLPLLRAPKTYNTDHPNYDPALVRNFPGRLYNADRPSLNPVLAAMRGLMHDGAIDDRVWTEQLKAALAELQDVPGAAQLFERKDEATRYFEQLNQRYGGHYLPGWMNLDDALFLYWLIRTLRPRTIVETGICNGFSAGVTTLALAQNGNDGELIGVGLAEIFDPDDPKWTEGGRVFGEVVVGEQRLGWMIPDRYQHWAKLYEGDARILLPEVVAKLDTIDLFFHNSDHSYDHMMFEFVEAKRKLSQNAIVVADNIAWNSSLWDFADECGVPAYNFRGSLGVAFF